MKKNILVSAYAVSPYRGSEYAAAWNTITQLAKQHRVWVLYGMSDAHMGDTQTMRQYIQEHPNPDITYIEVRAGWLAIAINLLNKAGLGWFFYFAYCLWQKQAYTAAKRLLKTVEIDVIHQLGPIGFREPGFLWMLGKPMVWGPIGGMMEIEPLLIKDMPVMEQMKFHIKNAINHFQLSYSPRIHTAFARADVLIAATTNGQQIIKEKFNRDSYHLPETWLVNNTCFNQARFNNINHRVELIWSGSHIHRKNLQLCLQSLSLLAKKNWMLHVLGSGPLTPSLKKLADRLGIAANITWHGQTDRTTALRLMSASHLHIITSVAEDNPNVITEAMSYGVPTLTINHFGMADSICSRSGFKIRPGAIEEVTINMAITLDKLIAEPQLLVDMAYTTISSSHKHHWAKRLARFNQIYDEAIAIHQQRAARAALKGIITV